MVARLLTALALLATGEACDYRTSSRSDFTRDVPLPDAAPGSPGWRATSLTLTRPMGLMQFQAVLIDPAVEGYSLNFIIQDTGTALRVGTAVRSAPELYAFVAEHPPATGPATRSGSTIATDSPLAFHILISAPIAVEVPLAAVRLTATVGGGGRSLEDGMVQGVIPGEEASLVGIDPQMDGNPDNDLPLIGFLGTPDTDLDGDGTVDDFAFAAVFSATLVAVSP